MIIIQYKCKAGYNISINVISSIICIRSYYHHGFGFSIQGRTSPGSWRNNNDSRASNNEIGRQYTNRARI